MKHLGDITKIHNPPVVDCITFGSPCQDLSIAGKRAGLAGKRSGLFMEAVRIIKEMEEQSGGLCPTFAIWENVPGAFSSNGGKDFHAVLEELARIKEPEISIPGPENRKWAKAGFICGNGWSIAWRTLDAQFWGVPQRRRRIALVLDLRGQRAGEILFERTGVSGNSEPSIPPWKGVARDPAYGAAGHDRVVALQGNMIDRDVKQNGSGPSESEIMFTLNTTDRHGVCFGIDGYNGYETGDKSSTIRAGKSDQDHVGRVAIPINTQIATRHISLGERTGMGWGQNGDPAYTLQAGHEHAVCCAAYPDAARALTARHDGSPCADRGPNVVCVKSAPYQDTTGPLMANSHPGSYCGQDAYSDMLVTCVEKHGFENTGAGWWKQSEVGAALRTPCGRDSTKATVIAELKSMLHWIVRRLIPTECERLQGYPDGWTDIGDWVDSKGKRHKAADSPRYKALGNSIALPQWWWITCKMAQYLPEHATLGSLFDGIGGFPLVWETRHGKGTAVWASEIEEFPIAVTKARFPE